MEKFSILMIAIGLDFLIGDPQNPHHPVRYIGRIISILEKKLYPYQNKKGMGSLLLILTPLIVLSIVYLLFRLCRFIHPLFYTLIKIYLVYACIAIRSLAQEGYSIYRLLQAKKQAQACQKLSYLVSRDTDNLDEKGMIRATVETLSENFTDSVFAPLFYYFIGGVPALIFYKTISTLDSMVGYKNDQYLHFGWASAKMDDLLNYLPARLAAFFIIPLAGFFCGFPLFHIYKIVNRDRLNHSSPNSAHSEAAFAGALKIQLGGRSSYFGQMIEKPVIGDPIKELETKDILKAIILMVVSSLISLLFFSGLCYLMYVLS